MKPAPASHAEGSAENLLASSRAHKDAGRLAEALSECVAALRQEPRHAQAWEWRSVLEQELGRRGEALASLEKAAALDPSRTDWAAKARALRDSPGQTGVQRPSDWIAALRALRHVRSRDCKDSGALLQAAGLLVSLDRPALAEPLLRRAAALEPRSAVPQQKLAEALWLEGRRAQAEAAIAKAAALEPKSSDLRLWAAALCEEMDDYRGALSHLEKAGADARALSSKARLELWSGEPAAALKIPGKLKGFALAFSGKHREALRELEAAPDEPEVRAWRAECLRRLGRLSEARQRLRGGDQTLGARVNALLLDLAEGRPVDPEARSAVTSRVPRPLWGKTKRAEDRVDAAFLERCLRLMAGNRGTPATFCWSEGGSRRLARHCHYFPRDAAFELQAKARHGADAVLAEFDRLVKAEPREAYLHASRGELLLWLGRYGEASRAIAKARALDPERPWPPQGLAAIALLEGRPREALKLLDAAQRNGGAPSTLACWRCEAYRRLGEPEKAVSEFEKAGAAPPYRPSLWINYALALGEAGRAAEQKRVFSALQSRLSGFLEKAASPAAVRKALEGGLARMKGNRSSWFYTWLDGGRLRLIRLSLKPGDPRPEALKGSGWMFLDARAERELAFWERA